MTVELRYQHSPDKWSLITEKRIMTEESACNMAALHDTNKAGLTV